MHVHELFIRSLLRERHENLVTALMPYAEDEDIYISFTDLPKIGINPQSTYDTPLGIYAYPLARLWPLVVEDQLPFASDRPYVQVLRSVGNVKDVSVYTDADYRRDLQTLRESYGSLVASKEGRPGFAYGSIEPVAKRLFGDDFDLKTMDQDQKGQLLAALTHEHKQNHHLAFQVWIEKWERDALLQKPIGRMWNITRNIALLLAAKSGGKPAIAWNGIFRKLGYDGFSDKQGEGIIHGNEPYQAVFFSVRAIKLIGSLKNVRKFNSEYYPVRTLARMTASLVETNKGKSSTFKSSRNIAPYVLAEWFELLQNGHSRHLKIDDKTIFFETAPDQWPAFVQAILWRDFNQFPKLAEAVMAIDELRTPPYADALLDVPLRNWGEGVLYAKTILGRLLYRLIDDALDHDLTSRERAAEEPPVKAEIVQRVARRLRTLLPPGAPDTDAKIKQALGSL